MQLASLLIALNILAATIWLLLKNRNAALILILFGMLMTLLPMIIGFIFGKFIFKFRIFNNLASITGGMTSTPALGTLISVAGTDEIAGCYAATYPIALVLVVLSAKIIPMIF